MTYKREIGAFGVLCASLGGIIGSGWLFGCLYAAQMAGPGAILSWLIGGVSMIFLALTFAELFAMFPISGAVGLFPVLTHGKVVGFILTWITWVTYVVSVSQEVQSTVFYLGNRYTSWVTKINGITQFSHTGYVVAFSIMFFLVCLNSFGSRFLSQANSIISIWKVLVPLTTVIIFLFIKNYSYETYQLQWEAKKLLPTGMSGVLSAVALTGVLYSFCGFQHGALLAGEVKNPQRSVPIAVVGSILLCILLYGGLQFAFIKVLPLASLSHGWHNLSFIGDSGPFAGLAAMLGLGWLVSVLFVDSVVSPLGTGVIYIASSARVVQSMSQSGIAPKFFAKLSSTGSPLRAIALNFIISMMAFMPFKGWQEIVAFLSSALVFSFAVGPICLASLRKLQPEKRRPFRLPFFQVLSFIAFYVCNLMIFWAGFDVVWKLAVTLAVGLFVFVLSDLLKTRHATKSDYFSSLWLFPYMIFFSLLSYYSSYPGGLGYVSIGADFIYLFVLSIIVFFLSQKMCLCRRENRQHMERILNLKSKPDRV